MSVDLQALLLVLEACRFKGRIKDDKIGGRRLYVYSDAGSLAIWYGHEENAALCFAMLDVLERAEVGKNRIVLRGTYPDEDEPPYACDMEPFGDSWGECWQKGYGATKTAAVAACVIAAHKAGLLATSSQGVTGE